MLRKIKKILLFVQYILHRSKKTETGQIACVEIKKIRPQRRLFHVCRMFTEAGFNCFLCFSFSSFVKLDLYGQAACFDPLVQNDCGSFSRKDCLFVSDSDRQNIYAKTIKLRYDVFQSCSDRKEALFYPIHFHPNIHDRAHERLALALSMQNAVTASDRMAVFFAGNCNYHHYNREETKNYFEINTRWEIFEHLQNSYDSNTLYIPNSFTEFIHDLENGVLQKKIVLINTNNVPIHTEYWLSILAKANFFIHMPGYIQPYCHNQVESIATGAIPISQFPYLFPGLKDKENCLKFIKLEGLNAVLDAIINEAIPLNKINDMRNAVLDYYIKRLSFDSFKKKINEFNLDQENNKMDLYICAGDESMMEHI